MVEPARQGKQAVDGRNTVWKTLTPYLRVVPQPK